MNQDEQYLKILAIFHFVIGGIAGLFACFPIIHFVMGIFMIVLSLAPGAVEGDMPFFPAGMAGIMFTVIAGLVMALGWAFALSLILAGFGLLRKRWYTFCLVMAGVACTFMPFGTVLGVFTLILLLKPEVKEMFEGQIAGEQQSAVSGQPADIGEVR